MTRPRPTLDRILAAVAEEAEVAIDDVKSRSNFREFVELRRVAMYLALTTTRYSASEIDRNFRWSIGSSSLARRTITARLIGDDELRNFVAAVQRRLEGKNGN